MKLAVQRDRSAITLRYFKTIPVLVGGERRRLGFIRLLLGVKVESGAVVAVKNKMWTVVMHSPARLSWACVCVMPSPSHHERAEKEEKSTKNTEEVKRFDRLFSAHYDTQSSMSNHVADSKQGPIRSFFVMVDTFE